MSGPSASARDTAIAEFKRAFDAERFFEAHEILEAYWIDYGGHDRGFFRGLIQAAVALHHFRAGNLVGAQGVAARSRRNLAPYAPTHLGFDVDSFVERLAREIG